MNNAHLAPLILVTAALAGPPALAATPEDQPIFAGVINKIFDSKCLSCHTADKPKGKLVMTSLESMTKGGESGKPGIVPGNSAESWIYGVMTLPLDHDDHKPPSNKPQPTEQELALIKWWIDAGAKPDVPVKDAGVPAELMPVVLELAAKKIEAPVAVARPVIAPKDLDQATKDTIAKISGELGVTILQLSQSDTGLMFTAVNVADKFDDVALAKLAPLVGQLADVNLGRTKVTDAGLATLAGAANLQRLRLENTAVTDAGLDHLKALEKLEYLNLFNTQVTDAGLEKLHGLKGLRRLYAWETKATKEGAEKLHAANNNVIINLGWDTEIGRPAITPIVAPAPAPEPAPTPAAPADPEASFFTALIAPVLERTCYSCHGEEKTKGGFQTHKLELFIKGGEEGGPGIVAGKPDESSVIKRLLLPKDADEAMPPEDKPQPTAKEIALIKWWVTAGADGALKVKDAQLPDDLK
ncbi:MAG: c-type cytochrome domain-containing protein [Verrucomicrobiales bacterium]